MGNVTNKLTDRQRAILDYIINHVADRGFPPSIREIGSAFGISSLRGVTVHLDALEKKGWIERESTSRSIRVLAPVPERRKDALSVPLLGTIAAGVPILAVENIESYVPVSEALAAKSGTLFALRVKGDSMIGDCILSGDVVIIRQQRAVTEGELAAVLLGDEATVKRVRLQADRVELAASNPAYAPIVVDREDAQVLGRVVGLVRTY